MFKQIFIIIGNAYKEINLYNVTNHKVCQDSQFKNLN